MRRAKLAVAAAVGVSLLLAPAAAADPVRPDPAKPVHLKSESEVHTARGALVLLPPGWFYAEPLRAKVDAEMKRLQEAEVRLKAENASLREAPGFGWGTITLVAGAVALGAAGGWWLAER